MKSLVKFDKDLGDDGAKAEGQVVIENSQIKAQVSISYPVAKIIEPATKAVDSLLDKLEKAIPGDWDKPMLEKVKQEYKEELAKLISEV